MSSDQNRDCGCRHQDPSTKPERPPVLKRRPTHTIAMQSEPGREGAQRLIVRPLGMAPLIAPVHGDSVTDDQIASLERQIPDWPRLAIGEGTGAVDIRVDDLDGQQVKTGSVVLESDAGSVDVPLDAVSRRFRAGGLRPGRYFVRASSSLSGRGTSSIEVRPNDVVRTIMNVDGDPVPGRVDIEIPVQGARGKQVHVRATDRLTGQMVFDEKLVVADGRLTLRGIVTGSLHLDFIDESGARSCYDVDVNDGLHVRPRLPDLIVQFPEFDPRGPVENPFRDLPPEFNGLASILSDVGIRSIRELAAVEAEDLMHRVRTSDRLAGTKIENRYLGAAVEAARAVLGQSPVFGEQLAAFRLGEGQTLTRAFLPASAGKVELRLDAPQDREAELIVRRGGRTERQQLRGGGVLSLNISEAEVAAAEPLRIEMINRSGQLFAGRLTAKFPGSLHVIQVPSTRQNIERIYQAVSQRNPGLRTTVPDGALHPENIRSLLDHARTLMALAGVCSIDDLGDLRINPLAVLRPGAYVARPKSTLPLSVKAVTHFAFSHLLSENVAYYRPNDTLHETAIVLASAWDIRGQPITIGNEVRELVVIARALQYDGASQITWEKLELPAARAYFPDAAERGPNGRAPGGHAADGEDGNEDPHPARNGGSDAATPAPRLLLYIMDTTAGLPKIDLKGQKGGTGGRGQDGGAGGDGAQGSESDAWLFGCNRDVGFGGNGGDGGNGGRGGPGGRGGAPGRVTLLTSDASIAALANFTPTIDVNPGEGGEGGLPGNPGPIGMGGPPGSADCSVWCCEKPERRGTDGQAGALGIGGRQGDPWPHLPEDRLDVFPLTDEQWQEAFNNPHILQVNPLEAEPGERVQLTGEHFRPGSDRIFFDGVNQPDTTATITSATQAAFTVPLTAEGGFHPIVIRPAGISNRRSNRVMLKVIPKLDKPSGTDRWVENSSHTLTGAAFLAGCTVLAEDRSVTPAVPFTLPSTFVSRTEITVQIPSGPLGNLRGVRRLVVRNPDGGRSRVDAPVRIGDTIVVKAAAFRVVGTTPGVGTTRSVADIANMFVEGGGLSLSVPWGQARIAFKLVQPVTTISIADDRANVWPDTAPADDRKFANDNGAVAGALNVFFFRDLEVSTAYAYLGGGPIFYADEGDDVLGPVDFLQVLAHEAGHALCLDHVCPNDGEEEDGGTSDTFFGRECEDDDEQYLMYPYWNASDSMLFATKPGSTEVDIARAAATFFEQGKTQIPTIPTSCSTVPDANF